MIKRENVELIQDGEYGRFEGTSDIQILESDVITSMKSFGYEVEKVSISFDTFQGFYRFDGLLKPNHKIGLK